MNYSFLHPSNITYLEKGSIPRLYNLNLPQLGFECQGDKIGWGSSKT